MANREGLTTRGTANHKALTIRGTANREVLTIRGTAATRILTISRLIIRELSPTMRTSLSAELRTEVTKSIYRSKSMPIYPCINKYDEYHVTSKRWPFNSYLSFDRERTQNIHKCSDRVE